MPQVEVVEGELAVELDAVGQEKLAVDARERVVLVSLVGLRDEEHGHRVQVAQVEAAIAEHERLGQGEREPPVHGHLEPVRGEVPLAQLRVAGQEPGGTKLCRQAREAHRPEAHL